VNLKFLKETYIDRNMSPIDRELDYDMLITNHHLTHIVNKIKSRLDTLLLNKILIQAVNSILITQIKLDDRNTSTDQILEQVKQSQWQKHLRRLYIDLTEICIQVDKFDKNIQRVGIAQLQDAAS